MKSTFTRIREVVTSKIQLDVDGFSIAARTNVNDGRDCIRCRRNVDGHDWEIRFHHALYVHGERYYCPGLELVFLGESRTSVTATLSGKVIQPRSDDDFVRFQENKTVPKAFYRRLDRSLPIYLGVGKAGDIHDFETCSLAVECTITVFREPAAAEGAIPVPSSDLTEHLGELLRSQAAADVTFSVSGECFAAHKSVLAARSPVFLAQFFGEGQLQNCQLVEIQGIGSAVFKAMLQFIYTDAVPELDVEPDAAMTALSLDLLIAADRYGLDKLKVMCELRLAHAMDASTLASMLVLAEQRNCSRLKAKCIESIAQGSKENLDAVLATEGYKNLEASSPSMLTELLKAAHGKKSDCSCQPHHGLSRSTQASSTLHTMTHTFTQINEGVQSVHLLKIDGFLVTRATMGSNIDCIKSRCTVDGYHLEIRFCPVHFHQPDNYAVALELALLGDTCMHGVEASLSGRLVEYESSGVSPIKCMMSVSNTLKHPLVCTSPLRIGRGKARYSQAPAVLTVECTITVFRDLKHIRLPTSDLHQHLDNLLQSKAGADITITVAGESFAAHKYILAARSPVFKAQFFGEMVEKTSQRVEIKDMDPLVFKAMLHFIYTDMVPYEFDNKNEAVGMVMAQHLLVAADRFGLDRLKAMSGHRLSLSIGIETLASTFALAEQFNCSHLKAKCVEFICGGSSKNLDAILATEGYRNLEMSSASLLTELVQAAHRNKRSRSTDA